jgi:multiple antibiotic resistance protein
MQLTELLSIFITLFVIIDPIGTVPVFVGLTGGYGAEGRRRVAKKAILVSGGVLLFFALLGQLLFDALGVRLVSFEIAGGIVLFLFGLKMVFDKPEGLGMSAEGQHDVAVFPLAIPSIAGPGAMLGVVVASHSPAHGLMQQAAAIAMLLLVLGITYLCLRGADRIHNLIGHTGALILSRVMGIILMAIATETVLGALGRLGQLR